MSQAVTVLSVVKVDRPRMSSVAPDTFLAKVEFSDGSRWQLSLGRSVFFGDGVAAVDGSPGDGVKSDRMTIGLWNPATWFGVMGFGYSRPLGGLRLAAVERDLPMHVEAAGAIVDAEHALQRSYETLTATTAAADRAFAAVGARFFDEGKADLQTIFQNSESFETDEDGARHRVRQACERLEAIRVEAAGAAEAVTFALEAVEEAKLALQARRVEAEALPLRGPVEMRKLPA